MCLKKGKKKPRKFEHSLPFVNHAWNLMEKEFVLLGKTKTKKQKQKQNFFQSISSVYESQNCILSCTQ